MHPSPISRAVTIMIGRGPNRSFNRPASTPKTPIIRKASDEAPAMTARDQPKVSIRGLKKTPKAMYVPTPRAWMEKQMPAVRKARDW
jgi:hypothetical protein